jgi:L-lysine exporter family protein LysE/ArgO
MALSLFACPMLSPSSATALTASAAFAQGAAMMAGLIVAIGAQNVQVLRQGMAGRHVPAVVLICTLSDWLLVALGVFGLGALIARQAWLLEVFRYGGALFLLVYGARAAQRAWRGSAPGLGVGATSGSFAAALGSTLALTYLNPHVYLDTVVLVGSVGAQHAGAARLSFVAGAWTASALWFAMLGFGASRAGPWLSRPAAWRAIDASVALVMAAVAAQLLLAPLHAG